MASKWIVPAVVLVLALSGCAGQSNDEKLTSGLRDLVPELEAAKDSDLIDFGHSVCDNLEKEGFEGGMDNITTGAAQFGLDEERAIAAAKISVDAYCQDFSDNF
jgi:hypothetical protein